MLQRLLAKLSGLEGKDRSIVTGSVASVSIRFNGVAISFVITVVLARLLGPSGFGSYSYGIALATLLTVIVQLGLPTLAVREASRYLTLERLADLRGLLTRSTKIVLAASVLAVGIAALIVSLVANGADVASRSTLYLALALIPCIAMNNVGGAALRALGRPVQGQLAEQLLRPGLMLVFLVASLLIVGSQSPAPGQVMALHVLAALISMVVGVTLLLRSLPAGIHTVQADYSDWPKWRSSLFALSLLAGLQVLNSQTDILMLGIFVDAGDVGIYRVAHQGASLVNIILFATGLVVEPTIAKLYANNEKARLQAVMRFTGRAAFALSFLATLVVVLFGEPLLRVVFGSEYLPSYLPLVILCMGQVGLAFAGWAVLLLNMTGHEKITTKFTAIAAVANVIANLLLIPRFGIYGAAVATASTVFLWKLGLAIVAERQTGIRTTIFPGKHVEALD